MGTPGAKTASKEFRASIKEAIRLIKAGGLQRLLNAPPNKPLAEFLGTLGCNEVCTQLYTLAMLADVVRRGHPALWVLPDPTDLYPRVFRWIAYLLPLKRGFSIEYRSSKQDIMLELLDGSIGIFQHVLSLPPDCARSVLLSEGHDAISDIVTIWLHWPELLAETKTKKDEERRSRCIQLPQSLWKALGQTDDDNALIATFFLRAVSHKPTRLFNFIARQLHDANLRLARDDDTAWADATSFVIISTLLLLYRDLSMRLIPGGMVLSMTIFTRLAAAKRPHLSEICLRLLNILCSNDSRALSTALTCGIFSLLAELHAARLCQENSLTKLRELISGALSFPKSVELFSAHVAMSDLVRQSWVLPEEKEVRDLAERRQALLQVASQDWEANVRCCNPNCSCAPDARLRGCPCGMAVYCSSTCQRADRKVHKQSCRLLDEGSDPEIGALRARDAHFMAHVVKDYLRENWTRLEAEVGARSAGRVPLLTLDIAFGVERIDLQWVDLPEPGGFVFLVESCYRKRGMKGSCVHGITPAGTEQISADADAIMGTECIPAVFTQEEGGN